MTIIQRIPVDVALGSIGACAVAMIDRVPIDLASCRPSATTSTIPASTASPS